jgi:hypothetical protein
LGARACRKIEEVPESRGLHVAEGYEPKKKNLEPVKGNRFAALQVDELIQMTIDANIKVANSYSDRSRILNNLLKADQDRFEDFVIQNPEIVHPINLDVNPEIET